MRELRVLACAGLTHGHGFPVESFEAGLAKNPDYIACDSGSSDPGAYYLGAGEPMARRAGTKTYLRILMLAALKHKVPLVIGSCGTAGAEPHLQWFADIAREIAREDVLHFKLALVHAEQSKDYVKGKLREGRIRPLDNTPPLSEGDVDRSDHIVGMMGTEPIIKAVEQGGEIVLLGRSSDSAMFAAIPMMKGYPAGLAWHMAKIVECGGMASEPMPGAGPTSRGGDSMFAYLRDDHFLLEPTHPGKRCTPVRVAAHTLYENASPYHLYEPSGMIDTTTSRYEQHDPRTAKISGTAFVPTKGTVRSIAETGKG